jgi:hypothetical protein
MCDGICDLELGIRNWILGIEGWNLFGICELEFEI